MWSFTPSNVDRSGIDHNRLVQVRVRGCVGGAWGGSLSGLACGCDFGHGLAPWTRSEQRSAYVYSSPPCVKLCYFGVAIRVLFFGHPLGVGHGLTIHLHGDVGPPHVACPMCAGGWVHVTRETRPQQNNWVLRFPRDWNGISMRQPKPRSWEQMQADNKASHSVCTRRWTAGRTVWGQFTALKDLVL